MELTQADRALIRAALSREATRLYEKAATQDEDAFKRAFEAEAKRCDDLSARFGA